jgi:hypothetical protein
MKKLKTSVVWVLFAGVILAAAIAVRPPAALAAEDTPLAKQMEQIQDAQKKLRKTVKDPAQNAASLEALTAMQQATVASKALVPARAAKVPEADRAKFVAAYRKEMVAMLDGPARQRQRQGRGAVQGAEKD